MQQLSKLAGTVAAVALGLAAAPSASAQQPVDLGAADKAPAASCPKTCQAIGRVSGYGLRHDGKISPYRAPGRGKIVSFTLTLGKPRADQVKFFNNLFGAPPQARISVVRRGSSNRHRLTGQSEVFTLTRHLGTTATFKLARPLTVMEGYVVALTVPSWAPAFSVNQGMDDSWRSSRDLRRCNDVRQSAAQQVRASLRTYGCLYKTARLLYTARFVPDGGGAEREGSSERRRGTDG